MTVDFTKVTASQLRELLIEGGISKEEAESIKGKSNLVNKVEELVKLYSTEENADDDVEDFAFEMSEEDAVESANAVPDPENDKPDYSSFEWQEYVMGLFNKKELNDGNPNVSGLRRVAELLLGPVVESGPEVVFHPTTSTVKDARATCLYKVVIFPFIASGNFEEKRVFKAAADSCYSNTDQEFAIYPSAMAETRAEVRALRKALRLSQVAHEEIVKDRTVRQIMESQKPEESYGAFEDDDVIQMSQVTFINKKCEQLGIDVDKFINSGSKTYNDISAVARKTAIDMVQRLNQYQSVGDESTTIPVEILKETE